MSDEQARQIIQLLTEIRDLLTPEPARVMEYDCRCVKVTGLPASNCPMCQGTGVTIGTI